MPSIYDIKPAFQSLLRPLVRRLASVGVTANQVTIFAGLGSVAVGAMIAWRPAQSWPLLVLPAYLFTRMALNAIDGMLAREHGQKSRLGAVLNELGDVVADAVLYLPLALVSGVDERILTVVVLLAVISEMAGVVAVQIGASRRYDGPMGKSDRAFAFGLLGLLLGLGVPAGAWVTWILCAIGGLLVVTILNRARRALAESAGARVEP